MFLKAYVFNFNDFSIFFHFLDKFLINLDEDDFWAVGSSVCIRSAVSACFLDSNTDLEADLDSK